MSALVRACGTSLQSKRRAGSVTRGLPDIHCFVEKSAETRETKKHTQHTSEDTYTARAHDMREHTAACDTVGLRSPLSSLLLCSRTETDARVEGASLISRPLPTLHRMSPSAVRRGRRYTTGQASLKRALVSPFDCRSDGLPRLQMRK